jgi:hypothetical protein
MSRTKKDHDGKKWSTGPGSYKKQLQHELNKKERREAKNVPLSLEDEENFLNPKNPNSVLWRYW